MGRVLWAAAAYNLTWGASAVLFPQWWFRFLGLDTPTYPELWQCLGMVVGVYGLLYAVAARDPHTHWAIVAVGLLGKLCGPLGFLSAVSSGRLPWSFGRLLLLNDLPWWIPFGLILLHVARTYRERSAVSNRENVP
jgi:hypothetical protein